MFITPNVVQTVTIKTIKTEETNDIIYIPELDFLTLVKKILAPNADNEIYENVYQNYV